MEYSSRTVWSVNRPRDDYPNCADDPPTRPGEERLFARLRIPLDASALEEGPGMEIHSIRNGQGPATVSDTPRFGAGRLPLEEIGNP